MLSIIKHQLIYFPFQIPPIDASKFHSKHKKHEYPQEKKSKQGPETIRNPAVNENVSSLTLPTKLEGEWCECKKGVFVCEGVQVGSVRL